MKKITILLLFLLSVLNFNQIYAADVIVGDGQEESFYIPFSNCSRYGVTQTLYTPEELLGGGTITSVSYYVSSAHAIEPTIKIWIGHTTQRYFEKAESGEDFTLVYDSRTTIGSNVGWETFTFNEPFHYNGVDNLVVIVSKDNFWEESIDLKYACTHTDKHNTINKYGDGDYNYSLIVGGGYYDYSDVRPNTKFTFSHAKEEIIISGMKFWIDGTNTSSLVGCGDCSGSVNIPSSVTDSNNQNYNVTRLYPRVFANQTKITSVIIPTTTTWIGESAFTSCYRLSKVDLESSICAIPDSAFYDCTSLLKISLPNNVVRIGKNAFDNCSALYKVDLDETIKTISDYAFNNCSGISSIDFPNSIDSIGKYAFANSTLLKLTLPQTIQYLGEYCFKNCEYIEEVSIPSSLRALFDGTFAGCTSINKVIIEDGTSTLTFLYDVFYKCNNMENVYVGRNFENLLGTVISDLRPFQGKSSIKNVTFGPLVTDIPNNAFGGTSIKKLVIPDHIETIGDEAFRCNTIDSIFIEGGFISFGQMSMDNSVKYLYWNCNSNTAPFKGRTSLLELVVGDNVDMLYKESFMWCYKLEKVTLGKNVELIQKDAFCEANSLKTFIVYAEEPPYCYPYVFTDTNLESVTLRVPKASLEAYKTTAPWSDFGTIEAIEDENALDVVLPDNGKKQYYTIDGKQSVTSSNGFYIIKNEDGSVQKVMVK